METLPEQTHGWYERLPMRMTAEVGSCQIRIRDFLRLREGSVAELDQLMGEPVDLLINGKLVARGNVVTVNNQYGIQLTDVVNPTDGGTKKLATPRLTQIQHPTDVPALASSALDPLLDLPLRLSVELGACHMRIQEIMQLGRVSIIELESSVVDFADILINGKLVGQGELVTINERYGIRVVTITSPSDRIKQLG